MKRRVLLEPSASPTWTPARPRPDLVIVALVALASFLVLAWLGVFRAIAAWNLWEVDDLLGLVVVGSLAAALLWWRRSQELRQALAELRILRGLLPICAWCKSIRESDGRWVQLERFIGEHAEVQFTHGICPRCHEDLKTREAGALDGRRPG